MNTAAIAVGAVHAAFDAHDSIDVLTLPRRNNSSQYYPGIISVESIIDFLHRFPNFGFIRSLSGTIGQINEMKTNCHDQSPDGAREMIECNPNHRIGLYYGFFTYIRFFHVMCRLQKLHCRFCGLIAGRSKTGESLRKANFTALGIPDDVEQVDCTASC